MSKSTIIKLTPLPPDLGRKPGMKYMAVYVTKKEWNALLAACDFISSNADGAEDYEQFEEMQTNLMTLFHKVKKDYYNINKKKLVKKYVKEASKTPPHAK